MLAKEITYTDFDGNERTETFYFNLTKAEVAEMELKHPGGYADYITRIIKSREVTDLIEAFTTLILNSYGEKSEDGRYFRKSPELSERFKTSEAYSELFMEIMSDSDVASAFVNGIMPKVDVTDEQKQEILDKMHLRMSENES